MHKKFSDEFEDWPEARLDSLLLKSSLKRIHCVHQFSRVYSIQVTVSVTKMCNCLNKFSSLEYLNTVFKLIHIEGTRKRLNPRTYKLIHTPTVVQGGWMEPPPLGFLLHYNILKRFYL